MASASLLLSLTGLLAVFVLSWVLTGMIRRQAARIGLIDAPNARSSHTVPTPRGGGVAIVAASLTAAVCLGLADLVEQKLIIAAVGAGGLVAVLGFLDDRAPMPARKRFFGHAIAAVWVLAWMGPLPSVPLFGVLVNLSYVTPALCWLYVVWMINLFNFMDGIDGIASVEAVTTSLGGALLWWWAGSGSGWLVALVFACSVAGFLVWNFPPAKIFLGDAGSGFLGLVVATLSLWSGQATPALFWSWFILIGCFMVDATTTLVRRVLRGERFFDAHRAHAYQYASRKCGRHLPVTVACGAINVLWLLPLASLVAVGQLDGLLGILIAYAPLLWIAYRFKAGDRAGQET